MYSSALTLQRGAKTPFFLSHWRHKVKNLKPGYYDAKRCNAYGMLFAILHNTTHICLSFFVIILISTRSLFDEMILSHKK